MVKEKGSAKLNLPGTVERSTGPESGSSGPGPASSHHSSTVWASAEHVLLRASDGIRGVLFGPYRLTLPVGSVHIRHLEVYTELV